MIIENMRNGHGYVVTEPDCNETPQIFIEDASKIMQQTVSEGDCLVEGGVGSGKTHLLQDIGRIARSSVYQLPTLQLSAHINGGSKRGVAHALFQLDDFAEKRGKEGVILLDNVDFFGYSGSKGKRVYGLALAHTEVARYIVSLMKDEQAPFMAGVAHNSEWRALKWRYKQRKGKDDEVTPVAQELLESFSSHYSFAGNINPEAARALLSKIGFTEAAAQDLIFRLNNIAALNYRIVARLTPQNIAQHGLEEVVNIINEGTRRRLGDMACSQRSDQTPSLVRNQMAEGSL